MGEVVGIIKLLKESKEEYTKASNKKKYIKDLEKYNQKLIELVNSKDQEIESLKSMLDDKINFKFTFYHANIIYELQKEGFYVHPEYFKEWEAEKIDYAIALSELMDNKYLVVEDHPQYGYTTLTIAREYKSILLRKVKEFDVLENHIFDDKLPF